MSIRKSASALLLAAAVGGVLPLAAPALAQSDTTVTYQGRLDSQGEPYSGTADVRFTLWTASSGGEQVPGAAVNTLLGVDIVDGLLTAPIDFGPAAFGSQPRFVEVQVRTPAWDGTGSEPAFTTLDPRQAITGAPYSVSTRGITVDENGAVGIFTTVPGRPLQVGDSGRESVGVIRVAHRTGSAFRRWDFGTGDGGIFGHPDNFGFRDLSGDTIMVLEATGQGGNVGIGVLDPSAKLDVAGGIRAVGNRGYTFSAPGDQDSGLFSFGNGEVSLLADGEAQVIASSTGLTLNFGDGSQQTTAYRPIVVRPVLPSFTVPDGGRFELGVGVPGAEPGMAVIVTPTISLGEDNVIAFATVGGRGTVRFRITSTGNGSGPTIYPAAEWRITLLP